RFARAELARGGVSVADVVQGGPVEARRALESNVSAGPIQVIACSPAAANWTVLQNLSAFPTTARATLVQPRSYWWPNFLKGDNLLNVANQIVVIAVVAIGMTMVIIAGGIDLSVGSLIALSAVMATRLIRDWAGAEKAGTSGLVLSSLVG